MKTENLNFGEAVEQLKNGKKVCRNGWNGKGMYLVLIKGQAVAEAINKELNTQTTIPVNDAIYMYTAQSTYVAWLASQSDVLSEDWCVLD